MTVSRALELAGIASRLRLHARRCRNDKGYRTVDDMSRADLASALRSHARMIDDGWPTLKRLRSIKAMLRQLDRLNNG